MRWKTIIQELILILIVPSGRGIASPVLTQNVLVQGTWLVALSRLPPQDIEVLAKLFGYERCGVEPTRDDRVARVRDQANGMPIRTRVRSGGCEDEVHWLSRLVITWPRVYAGCALVGDDKATFDDTAAEHTTAAIRLLSSLNVVTRQCAVVRLAMLVTLAHTWPGELKNTFPGSMWSGEEIESRALDVDDPAETWDVDPKDWMDEYETSMSDTGQGITAEEKALMRLKMGGIRLAYLIHYSLRR